MRLIGLNIWIKRSNELGDWIHLKIGGKNSLIKDEND